MTAQNTTAATEDPTRDPAPTPAGESFDEVYAHVLEVLRSIVGEDYFDVMEVLPETRFEADLELESMEIVQLAESLMVRYDQVDFIGWFATMELDELIDLSVGILVEFIVRSVSGAPTATGTADAAEAVA